MTIRVNLDDRDYSAALFNMQSHQEKGYHIISAMLVLKEGKHSACKAPIEAQRVHIYSRETECYEANGEKVPDSVYILFCRVMGQKEGHRVTIKEIVEEDGRKLDKKIIAVGVDL